MVLLCVQVSSKRAPRTINGGAAMLAGSIPAGSNAKRSGVIFLEYLRVDVFLEYTSFENINYV
jgi:hypothetical protein